jgi:hypothetical protein
MQKFSDDDILRRGPVPEKHGLVGLLTVLLTATLPFIFGAGFVIGGLTGGALSLWAGAGAAEFVAGAAMGMLWGGILSVAGVLGAGLALGYADERYEKKARAVNDAYENALERRAAAKKAAAGPEPEPAVLSGGAAKAFAVVRNASAHGAPSRGKEPARLIPPRAA